MTAPRLPACCDSLFLSPRFDGTGQTSQAVPALFVASIDPTKAGTARMGQHIELNKADLEKKKFGRGHEEPLPQVSQLAGAVRIRICPGPKRSLFPRAGFDRLRSLPRGRWQFSSSVNSVRLSSPIRRATCLVRRPFGRRTRSASLFFDLD